MKKSLGYLSIALLLPAMSLAATVTGLVTGTIPGTTSAAAIVGAKIVLIGGTSTVLDSTTTDATGRYTFTTTVTGFIQVMASATGYTPASINTASSVATTTSTATVNFTGFTSASGANAPGTSSIGGLITSGGNAVAGVKIVLRRRATTTSAYVLVDSTISDVNTGAYLFSNILAAGTGTTANAYTLVVSKTGYTTVTSATQTVANGATTILNVALTATALNSVAYAGMGIRFSTTGDHLILDLGAASSAPRTVFILSPNGTLRYSVPVAMGESHASVPAAFSKGYLFQVK